MMSSQTFLNPMHKDNLARLGVLRFFLVSGALALAGAVSAQPVALVKGPNEQVTTNDLRAAGHRLPLASRDALMSRPDTIQRQAEDLYVRRLLAKEAERDGLDKDPVVHALIQQARERILSEARLVEIDLANLPKAADAERAAREIYTTNPERFNSPEQTRASHILIAKTNDDAADRERAVKLVGEIRAGARFEDHARLFSADTASASKGGDLGWFSAGTMVKEFEEATAKLESPGELSEPVATRFGWHIIRLDERKAAGRRSFDDVKADLVREVQAKAQAGARETKIRQLLEGAEANPAAIENFAREYRKP